MVDSPQQAQGWRAWSGLTRGLDLAIFVIALLVVAGLIIVVLLDAPAVRPVWVLGVAVLCMFASNRLDRGRGHLLTKRLGEIHQAFRDGTVPQTTRASRVLSVLGMGLLVIHLWLAFRG